PLTNRATAILDRGPRGLFAKHGGGWRRLLPGDSAATRAARAADGGRVRPRRRGRDARGRRPLVGEDLHRAADAAGALTGLRQRSSDAAFDPVVRYLCDGRVCGLRPGPGNIDVVQRRASATATGPWGWWDEGSSGRRALRAAGSGRRDDLPGGGGRAESRRPDLAPHGWLDRCQERGGRTVWSGSVGRGPATGPGGGSGRGWERGLGAR